MLEDQTFADLSTRESREPRARRVISQRRREQNKIAQKTYREKKKCYLRELETIAQEARGAGSRQSSSDKTPPAVQIQDDMQLIGKVPTSCHSSSLYGERLGQPLISDEPILHVNEIDPSVFQELGRIASPVDLTTRQDDSTYASKDYTRFFESIETDGYLIQPSTTLSQDSSPLRQGSSTSRDVGETTAAHFTSNVWTQAIQLDGVEQHSFVSSGLSDLLNSQSGVVRNYSLEDILMAGIRAISQKGHQPNNEENESSRHVDGDGYQVISAATQDIEKRQIPNIHINTIQLTSMSFVAACSANAEMLGVSLEALMDKTTQSPFFQAQMESGPLADRISNIKPLLRPSPTQINYPHHVYLDVLPFPAFRSRIIQLLQIRPLPFDPEDLCHDLCNDGIICWGSTRNGGNTITGTGVPWDIRSWEIKSWFLKKWWILFDGPNDIILQNTQWWCELRGENFS